MSRRDPITGGVALGLAVWLSGVAFAQVEPIAAPVPRAATCFVSAQGEFPCEVTGDIGAGNFRATMPNGWSLMVMSVEPDYVTAYIDRWSDAEFYEDPDGADYQWVRPWELGELWRTADDPACWGMQEAMVCAWLVR